MSKKLINGKILAVQLGRNETQIALVGKNSEILHGITVPTPMGAVEDGMIHNQEAITELLKEALQIPKFKGVRQVVFSLCTSQVIMETTTTPNLPKAKLEKLILANADMYFPVDIRDYRLIWEVVDVKKNDAGTKEASVQLWAVPNEMLRTYYLAANACGLSVVAIDYCGHSAATAVGATFARPVKPPKAKPAKDPAAPKEPKTKKKIDWNAEITFGKKKKVEPELPQEEAGPQVIPATDMHILMDNELLGLTFVQEGQVVYQRFYRCGADPSYQFSELAMMVEYFQTQDIGRDSEIRGYVSGPGSVDTDMVELLAGMLGIPLAAFQTGADPRWLLCAGAARTNLEFGNPEFNKVVRVSRTINTDLWQYAAILASGAALVMVVMMLLNARLGWGSEVSGLENEYTILSGQAAQVNGFKKNYEDYVASYDAYDRDWDALFNSLHTYNDNLVFVLKELETVMPENTSVTDIIIDSDSVMISFACDDKEEAAYLIMSLRDMEYVDVNTISNLIGGGKGAATEYGTPIEEVTPPTEGGSEEEILAVAAAAYNPRLIELSGLREKYGVEPASLHTDFAAFLEANDLTDEAGRALRVTVVEQMLHNNPFVVDAIARIAMVETYPEDKQEEMLEVLNNTRLESALAKADEMLNVKEDLEKAEARFLGEPYLKATYIHYLEATLGLWGDPVAPEEFGTYCPYVDMTGLESVQTDPAKAEKDLWAFVKDQNVPQQRTYSSATPAENYQHVYSCVEAGDLTEACTYIKTAGVCDVCAAECDHPESRTLGYVQIEGQLKHAITCECGKTDLEADCADEAGDDEKCDDCGAFICSHSLEKGHTYTRTENDDGLTHTVTCDCGEVIAEAEACIENDNGKCDCGRNLCKHLETKLEQVVGKHAHNVVCIKCAEVMEAEVSCVPGENETCVCGRDMSVPCDHEADILLPSTPEKGKHTYTCECGEETREEDCVDIDPEDLVCDTCKGEIPVPEEKPDDSPVTRGEIEDLWPLYGNVPQPNYKGSMSNFLGEKKPSYYERKAAVINLFNTNAFAANCVVEDAISLADPVYQTLLKDYIEQLKDPECEFEDVRTGMTLLIKELSGSPNEEMLSKIEKLIQEADAEYDLDTAYLYYLEVAMGEQQWTKGEYPHLKTIDPKETGRTKTVYQYVQSILDEEGFEVPDVLGYDDMLLMMSNYLKGLKKDAVEGVDNDTAAALNAYFFEGGSGTAELDEMFNKAVKENSTIIGLLESEFSFSKYDSEKSWGKNIRSLIEAYGNNQITGNQTLLLALQKAEKQAEINKDLDQDDAIKKNEERIEKLEKELESLKKAASDQAEEEAGGGAGGGSVKGDTRVFLDIGLLYTEELWNQELQRKGLDRSAKVPKLELEVAG